VIRVGLTVLFIGCALSLAAGDTEAKKRLDALLAEAEQSVFWAPFGALPPGLPAPERGRLRTAGRAAIAEAVLPAYRALLDFFTRAARCSTSSGRWDSRAASRSSSSGSGRNPASTPGRRTTC